MRNDNEELVRARDALASSGCDFVLLSSPADITYVSGYDAPLPVGPFADLVYSPPLALIGVREPVSWLIVGGLLLISAAKEKSRLDHIVTYEGFDPFHAVDLRVAFMQALSSTLRSAGLENRRATVGIEGRTLQAAVAETLARDLPDLRQVEVEDYLERARMIKTPREVDLIRRAAHVCDVGHMALAELVREPGRTEFEMWAEVTLRMYQEVGHEIPLFGELVTGLRTSGAPYPGGPQNRITETGDGVTMDISPRVNGYWSDCTNSHIVGQVEPTATQLKYARASQKACEAAIAALHPGALASQVWEAAASELRAHCLPVAHHAGHQLGTSVNESPRLVPYDHTPIQANMVFAVEPGAYEGPGGTFGARSEKVVLVTESGPEVLSTFEWGIRNGKP
jgi:Xaa-Pro aminopeptidase